MSFNVVFFLMAAILLTLALFSKFFRKNEQIKMNLEAKYFEALKNFKAGTLDKAGLLNEGALYFKNIGLTPAEGKIRVERDLTLVKSSN